MADIDRADEIRCDKNCEVVQNDERNGKDAGDVNDFFFFSSRRRHTRSLRDWSSDVCSSDLIDGRPAGSALYFMVTPDAPVRLHRIRNDQLYHHYLGDPIEVLMLHENGTSERAIVGPDLRAGQCVQLLIPGNTFHTARVIGDRRWFLGASTEWPGVERVDVEIGDVEALAAKYPDVADDLRAFQKGSGD